MNTSRFASFPRRCILLFALLLVSALTACGGLDGNGVDASNSSAPPALSLAAATPRSAAVSGAITSPAKAVGEFSDASSQQLTEQTASAYASAVQASAAIAAAHALIGTVIEFAPSSPKLTLDQFSDEVRAAMNARESQTGLALQWSASFHRNKTSRRAYVTVVAAGLDQSPTVAAMNTSTIGVAYATASSSFSTDSGLSAQQMKEAVCAGGSAATYEQYYAVTSAYSEATEAIAVGLSAGTSRDVVRERLIQLQEEEALMAADQSERRMAVRMATRDQREKALRQCRES